MELATWPMTALGIIGGLCQILAHIAMWNDGRPDVEGRVRRYVVGTLIMGIAFTLGWQIDPTIHPVTGLWQIVGWSFIAVATCYEARRYAERRKTRDAAASIIKRLEEELGNDVSDAPEGHSG